MGDRQSGQRVTVSAPYTDALIPAFLQVVNEPGHKFIGLSGGNTPRAFLRRLAGEFRAQVPWDRVSLYQVDERSVPPDHPESNWKMIRESLLDAVPGIEAHRMRPEDPSGAEDYEALVRRNLPCNDAGVPVFDLLQLGLGPDGHTASLFPGTRALDEVQRLVVKNEVPQLGTVRMTMTYPLINAARHRWFIATGAGLRGIFNEVLAGSHPAGKIRDPEWFVEPEVVGD